MRFYNGDYIKFIETAPKLNFFDKFLKKRKKENLYICSYTNHGKIKYQHELKIGEIYRVRHHILSLLAVEIIDYNFSGDMNDLYFYSNSNPLIRWQRLDKKETEQLIRKEKLKRLQSIF